MSGRRVFGDDCDLVGHEVGDRHDDGNGLFQEWTGQVWTRVCPACDLPMSDCDDAGWLRCAACGLRAVDAR